MSVEFLVEMADNWDDAQTQAQDAIDTLVACMPFARGWGSGTSVRLTPGFVLATVGGIVDVARFGETLGAPSFDAVGADLLRVLAIGGPVVEQGVAAATRATAPRLLQVTRHGQENDCAWVSAENAVRMTGRRHFVTLADLMRRAGLTTSQINDITRLGTSPSVFTGHLLPALRRIGIRVVEHSARNLDELAALITGAPGRRSGTFVVGVRRPRTRPALDGQGRPLRLVGQPMIETIDEGHMVAFRYAGGAVKVFDANGRVYDAVDDFARATGWTEVLQNAPVAELPYSGLLKGRDLQGVSLIERIAFGVALPDRRTIESAVDGDMTREQIWNAYTDAYEDTD